jgi:hypothetical protein
MWRGAITKTVCTVIAVAVLFGASRQANAQGLGVSIPGNSYETVTYAITGTITNPVDDFINVQMGIGGGGTTPWSFVANGSVTTDVGGTSLGVDVGNCFPYTCLSHELAFQTITLSGNPTTLVIALGIQDPISYLSPDATGSAYLTVWLPPGLTATELPLPAALPLFATGLGAVGLLGWRRKKKAQA